ncbi:PREDICTED: feline leukemia virus subgroup C receptor-related protein 2-like [Diuraphis noxia]|uniref:feline leukemia virus subgroup C receptor-related protein 2-like n=1 Tax=Diuraphis noxia TaxID=143948 RepID=UPI000763A22C|nr:PREDICTED: feline leukemia virus subgroup C receptor-related protein 2-like [Diuraphis noxia]
MADFASVMQKVDKPPPPTADAQLMGLQQDDLRLYKARWIILVVYMLYSMANAVHWIQYSIISNITVKFYGVSNFAIDTTSTIYMIVYVPLVVPASWVLDRLGLKVTMVMGAAGTCLGAWIKVFSAMPDRFMITLLGQGLVACSQAFILSLPSRLAAVWFGSTEVSTACSLGVFGNQLGAALGFLIPPMIVQDSDNLEDIGYDLWKMFISFAILNTVVFFLVIWIIQAEPHIAPSNAQVVQRKKRDDPAILQDVFMSSVKELLKNNGYILLLISYGINVGAFFAISTLLNQFILLYFPGHEEDVGRIGLTLVLCGLGGSIICGYILDKTHLYKETTLMVYGSTLISMLIYTFSLSHGQSIWIIYITASLLGLFMTGYLPVGYELAIELTYPIPEGTSSGLLNGGTQLIGFILTSIYSWVFSTMGDLAANMMIVGLLSFGFLLTIFIPTDLKRQAAHKAIDEKQKLEFGL